MKRREFISLIGGAAAVWPLGVHAQSAPKIPRIGLLSPTTPSGVEKTLPRFRAGLRDLGYVEGQNILLDFRWAEGNYARLAEYAAELVRLRVDVLATYGTPGTLAAKQATTTTPIVMIISGDAVATGIVASLARPGGNVTGSTFFDPELHAKRLELVKEIAPSARRVAVLYNPSNPVNAPVEQAMERTAQSLKLELQSYEAQRPDEFGEMFSRLIKTGTDWVAVTSDAVFRTNAERIAQLATKNRLPLIGDVDFGQSGALIGFGANLPELWYRGAYFVDKILKGAKPAGLPVEQPIKFELIVNLKTAKALGLDVPWQFQQRADEVIE
jgi:putative ABC transport system substrate-binding protein